MKRVLYGLCVLPWLLALKAPSEPRGFPIYVAGGIGGYLSPCGCVEPMSGGIRRWVRVAQQEGPGLTVVNGGLVAGNTRQDQLKLETLAQAFASLSAKIGLSRTEANLGLPSIDALNRLVPGNLVNSQLVPRAEVHWREELEYRGLTIKTFDPNAELTAQLIRTSIQPTQFEADIILFQGDFKQASDFAKANPQVRLVVYESTSSIPKVPLKVGKTWLVTPGEHGKEFLKLYWNGHELAGYRVISLGPEISDDPPTNSNFRTYLARVAQEKLLDKLPRIETPGYAGSDACLKCHEDAGKIWEGSAHSHALATLEHEGQDRDPDCVGCHVVGLNSKQGFLNRMKTPKLSDVGCESCHGPGAEHVEKGGPIKRSTLADCVSCHTPQNSPTFDEQSYWSRIKH